MTIGTRPGHAEATKREQIAAALREHPEDSHRAIARRFQASPTYVGNVCSEVSMDTSACRHGKTGQGARMDRERHADRRFTN